MKPKHFGRFVITREGVRLLDVEVHARETAKKEHLAAAADQEPTLEQLQAINGEALAYFLQVSKKAADRIEADYVQELMSKILSLEEEHNGLDFAEDTGAIQQFSKKVGKLGREIMARSNL